MLSTDQNDSFYNSQYSAKPVFTNLSQDRRTPIIGIDMISAQKLINEALEKYRDIGGTNHQEDDSKILANPKGIIKSYLNQAEAMDPVKFNAYKKLCFAHVEEYHNQQTATEFSCLVCNSIFSNWNTLQRHLQYHADFKPFSCDVCNRTFYSQCKLKRHMVVHDTVKRYKCPICDRRLGRTEHLKRHLLVHTDNKSFGCSSCTHTTKRLDGIRRHIKRKHALDGAEIITLTSSKSNLELIGSTNDDNFKVVSKKIIKFQDELDEILEPRVKKKKANDDVDKPNCKSSNVIGTNLNMVNGANTSDNVNIEGDDNISTTSFFDENNNDNSNNIYTNTINNSANDNNGKDFNQTQNKVANRKLVVNPKLQHMLRDDNVSKKQFLDYPYAGYNNKPFLLHPPPILHGRIGEVVGPFQNPPYNKNTSYINNDNNNYDNKDEQMADKCKNYSFSLNKISNVKGVINNNGDHNSKLNNHSKQQQQQQPPQQSNNNHPYSFTMADSYNQQQAHQHATTNLKSMPPIVIGQYFPNHYHHHHHNHHHGHGFSPLTVFGMSPPSSFSS